MPVHPVFGRLCCCMVRVAASCGAGWPWLQVCSGRFRLLSCVYLFCDECASCDSGFLPCNSAVFVFLPGCCVAGLRGVLHNEYNCFCGDIVRLRYSARFNGICLCGTDARRTVWVLPARFSGGNRSASGIAPVLFVRAVRRAPSGARRARVRWPLARAANPAHSVWRHPIRCRRH